MSKMRTGWLKGSLFTEGLRITLDRNARNLWRLRVEIQRRERRLTASEAVVAVALSRRLGVDGCLEPAHKTIATDAGVSERTVRRALDKLRGLGLLTWQRRLVRRGWRAEQTSNSYALLLGEAPAITPPASAGQVGRAYNQIKYSKGQSQAQRQPLAGKAEIDQAMASTDEAAKWAFIMEEFQKRAAYIV